MAPQVQGSLVSDKINVGIRRLPMQLTSLFTTTSTSESKRPEFIGLDTTMFGDTEESNSKMNAKELQVIPLQENPVIDEKKLQYSQALHVLVTRRE